MIRKVLCKKNSKGFTLFEVVITLIIAGVLASFLIVFMGRNISQSAIPVVRVRTGNQLSAVMEDITAEYREGLRTNGSSFNLTTFLAPIDTVSEINSMYGANIDNVTITNSGFASSGGPELTTDTNTRKIILTQDEQSVAVIFTD